MHQHQYSLIEIFYLDDECWATWAGQSSPWRFEPNPDQFLLRPVTSDAVYQSRRRSEMLKARVAEGEHTTC